MKGLLVRKDVGRMWREEVFAWHEIPSLPVAALSGCRVSQYFGVVADSTAIGTEHLPNKSKSFAC
jgi:hypothetical protein